MRCDGKKREQMLSCMTSKDAMTQKTNCLHIYKNLNTAVCTLCAQSTHETDWALERELRRDWVESGKAAWSVCPVEGGTIRGWWSI